MTPLDCIDRCLQIIQEQFYHDKPVQTFYRDKRNLTKAILRYGFVCDQTGWQFDSFFITRNLIKTLTRITAKDVDYIPAFLEACIDNSVRQRADELNEEDKLHRLGIAKARKSPGKFVDRRDQSIEKVVGRIKDSILPDTVVVVEKSDTEVLAAMYRELSKRKPKKVAAKQMSLF